MRRSVRTAGLVFSVALSPALAACGSTVSAEQVTADAPVRAPLVRAHGEPQLTCGIGPAFTPSSLAGGGEDRSGDRGEVATALRKLVQKAGGDAPTALRGTDIEQAEWFVLERASDAMTIATGPWGPDGPEDGGQAVALEASGGGWTVTGWGQCDLAPVPQPGKAWVDVTVGGDPAPTATAVSVLISEQGCTSGRDPVTFLNPPVVVVTEHSMTVYWTSTAAKGNRSCPGNPPVEQVLELPKPLGGRALLDGSTWPPQPMRR